MSDLLRSALALLGAREIELAFDQDLTGWEGTLRLLDRLEDGYPALSYLEWSQDHKGPDDAIQAGADFHRMTGADRIRALMEAKIAQTQPPQDPSPANGKVPRAYNGRDFRAQHWEKPPFLVPELIVPGLTILAGKPKIGKSWFILDLCISLATGSIFLKEKWAVDPCPVLYMALEEVPWSLQERTEKFLKGKDVDQFNVNFHIAPQSLKIPRMPEGSEWLKSEVKRTGAKLVIIDTLEKFRPTDLDGKRHSYSGDYELLVELKEWADTKGVALVCIHHTRKSVKEGQDMFDAILGSTGLLGAPDTLILLEKVDRNHSDEGFLKAEGRQVPHLCLPLWFDDGQWSERETGEDTQKKPGKISPAKWLRQLLADGKPMGATELYAEGKKVGYSEPTLKRHKLKIPSLITEQIGPKWYWRLEGVIDHDNGIEVVDEGAETQEPNSSGHGDGDNQGRTDQPDTISD